MPQIEHPNSADLLHPGRSKNNRTVETYTQGAFPARMQSLAAPSMFAGSYANDMRVLRPDIPQHGSYAIDDEARAQSEKRQAELRDGIEKETKIKIGSENMLEALTSKNAKGAKEQKRKVEEALQTANRKLQELRMGLENEIQRSKEASAVADSQPNILRGAVGVARPASRQTYSDQIDYYDQETESPSYILSELLEALDSDGLTPEDYVENMNRLVELLKRYPSLRYDLAWQTFGLRMQIMLLSESRVVVAAGYRVLRYAITDRKSLKNIRSLCTDYLVILSLVKDSKASVEREQALKFVRAFLDVKDGVQELSRPVLRIIVAVSMHGDDRLRNIALLTLAEVLVRDPKRLTQAGGMGPLSEALGHGSYRASQGLTNAFIYLLDTPKRRKFLQSGHELEPPLATFGASPLAEAKDEKSHEAQLKASAKVIITFLRSWPGLITLSMNDFSSIRSLVASLYIPMPSVRMVLLELFTEILRIKPPSWSSSFLAGRRLTTYARVTNLKSGINLPDQNDSEEKPNERNLVDHFTAVVLAVLLHSGLIEALLNAEEEPLTPPLKRKTSLLLGEVLKMSFELLPTQWASSLQVLPKLMRSGIDFSSEERFVSIGTLYQIDSVNRTLYRSEPSITHPTRSNSVTENVAQRKAEQTKAAQNVQMDETQFRAMMLDSGVLNTVNFTKWRWDIIQNIIEGPLKNPKRLDEAIRSTKFLHRMLGFYRPFKFRFSECRNTKPNQRYVRIGCSLMATLILNQEGVKYLGESKLIRQLAECLAHFDRLSGLTSETPIFTYSRLQETLVGGYFALLGTLSKEASGLLILERWRIFNMFYHIIELRDRDDLIKALLSGLDFTLDSHLRIILSKAMTSCTKEIRIFATRLLRKYATIHPSDTTSRTAEWAIRMLVTQLYDPEIEVCEVAVKILEEACKHKHSLEYIVKCRPALDHLGEIGAPLLLRFLSTSVGYKYLDDLDYITREMDDWFLGRNDTYVSVVETSLARAMVETESTEKKNNANTPASLYTASAAQDDGGVVAGAVAENSLDYYGIVPPHFYRELTRTEEGCKLLVQTGHFDTFAATIADFAEALDDEDAETIIKVKGCLWAVANVGSMELGASFLEESNVIQHVVRIAEDAEVMSVRGTAFFALGLISRSLHGQEILTEFGWDGSVNMQGECLGFCMPLDLGKLFKIKPWVVDDRDGSSVKGEDRGIIRSEDPNPAIAKVLKCVATLANTVLSKKAATELNGIKARKPQLFQSTELFYKVMLVLESHHFHHQMWCFTLNLFDKRVMRRIVLDEDDNDSKRKEDDDSSDGDKSPKFSSQNESSDENNTKGDIDEDD